MIHSCQCLRLQPDNLQSGMAPKKLFKGSQNVIPTQSFPNKKFKVQQQIDLRSVRYVQYNREVFDNPKSHLFTFWTSKASELLSSSSMDSILNEDDSVNQGESIEKLNKAAEKSILSITLEGLSVGEAINFEGVLEEEIGRFGGHAD